MKKLFLLTLTLFLFGCDLVEKDTRLICDCIYEYDSFEQTRMECRDDPSYKNAALVFNESNEKFVFNKFSGGGNLRSEFTKDEIVRMETTDFDDNSFFFDRINLKLTWIKTYKEQRKFMELQCRLTDGV